MPSCRALFLAPALLLAGVLQTAAQTRVTATEFGALPDGSTVNTAALQAALDHIGASGGGTLVIPPGTFVTGTLFLRSNTELHLQAGAVLLGSPDLADYARASNGNQMGMLFAQDVQNLVLSGTGTIDGNGRSYVYPDRVKDLPREIKASTRQGFAYLDTLLGVQEGPVVPFEHARPYQMLLFSGLRNLVLMDLTIADSPFWAVHVADSDDIRVENVRVRNSLLMANADGLNFTSSSHIVITGCDIVAGDDALAFSGYAHHYELPGYRDVRRLSENVTVSNCLLQSRSSGIRVGGLDQNSLRNYRFDAITIHGSNRGIGLFVHQDGSLENIHFSDITIQTRLHTGDWWGNGEPIHLSVIEGAPVERTLGTARDISFTNIRAESEAGILVYGDRPGAIQDLQFRNVRLKIANGPLQDSYGGNFDLRPALEFEKNLFAHDVAGIHIRHAERVSLRDVHVEWKGDGDGEGEMHPHFRHGLRAQHVVGLDVDDSRISPASEGELPVMIEDTEPGGLFAMDNLVAWCVVPYDVLERTPKERARMLAELGFERMAWDWRDRHLPLFEEEITELSANGIALDAAWFWLDARASDGLLEHHEHILSTLERTGTTTTLWVSYDNDFFAGLSDRAKLRKAVRSIGGILERAREDGHRVALYNHGDWFGEPENQVRILRALGVGPQGSPEIGLVYNFHHAHG